MRRSIESDVGMSAGLPPGRQFDDVDAPAPAGGYDADRPEAGWGAFTMTIVTIGLDLAKSVFQVHGVDETGATALTKRLHRKQMAPFFSKLPRCLIAMEACGTAHYWARTLAAMGHEIRLVPPSYVKAYVKRGKSDALDAEAICEAVQRPAMRFVPVKTVEQQSILMAHRARSLLVRQRTMLANALRAHLAELGLVANPRDCQSGEARSTSAVGREWLAILRAHPAGSPGPPDHDAFRGDHDVGS
jgi:transposase